MCQYYTAEEWQARCWVCVRVCVFVCVCVYAWELAAYSRLSPRMFSITISKVLMVSKVLMAQMLEVAGAFIIDEHTIKNIR